MSTQPTILVVDDEDFIQLNLKNIFDNEDYRILTESDGKSALEKIRSEEIDLAFLDLNLPDMTGLEVLKEAKKRFPDLLVIIMTGYASVESAVEAIKLGAYDYIKKPFKADAIKLITKLGFETLKLKKKVQELEEERHTAFSYDSILGESEKTIVVKHQIAEYAKYGTETVLITGESGSGKELASKAIHFLSSRSDEEFVEINCASIPDNLLESELFGYEKGAFTDAHKSKIGLFEKANKGTLFLDEIGEMSLMLQAKLLRVLESKKFRRLGSTKDIEVDIRIIAATNKILTGAIERKEFRQDLYYRLDVLRINMPPLRERENDIMILARHFLKQFNSKFNKQIENFSPEAEKIFINYSWPGNVRELKNIIERISILCKSKIVDVSDLPFEHAVLKKSENNFDLGIGHKSFEEITSTFEIKIIEEAFAKSDNNISKTARILQIPRETLRYKIKKYNLSAGEN